MPFRALSHVFPKCSIQWLRVLKQGAIVTSLGCISLTGCSQPPSSSQTDVALLLSEDRPNHLIWLRPGDVDTLDPHRTSNVFSWQVFGQVYDTLLAFDDDGTVRSQLAQNWTVSEDGLSITFNLRDNIQCHDGTVFDAEDVKFTMDRALNPDNPSTTSTNWGPIVTVNIIDPLTVVVDFAEPFSAFLPFMADPFASMLCDSVVEQGSAFGPRSTVGTGPWKVLEWRHGDELVLGRHDAYINGEQPVQNSGAPYVEQLIVRTVTDAYARLTDLERNDAHVIVDPPIAELNTIQQNAQLSLQLAQKTGQSVFFQFTVSRPPFDDVRARQAVAHAINPEAAIFQTWGNLVQREYCPVARGVFGNDQDFCQQFSYEYNPEKSKALLEEMGYGPDNPLEVRLLTWLGDQREAIVGVFQEQLHQVGINAELDIMDISTLNARVRLENQRKLGKGALDLMGWAWYDPDILYALWHSPGAYAGYTHPDLDELLEQTRTTLDPDERLKAIQSVQTYLLREAVVIPVYTPGWLWIYATDSTLNGFKLGRFSRPFFNDVILPSSQLEPIQ